MQEEGWVVCRAFKKRTTNSQSTKSTVEGWDTSYFYEEAASRINNSMVDPIDQIISRQPQSYLSQSYNMCKQEIEACMHAEQFLQLPQLESPSLPLVKRPSTMSLVSENNNDDINDQNRLLLLSNNNDNITTNTVTDWRALDKFVASQLSHEVETDHQGVLLSSFGTNNNPSSDMALMLLQQGNRDEENKLSPFLNASSDCSDIGICVFEK